MEIPVYLFTGFLEAGKTKFIQETLEDERFNDGQRTLLILCEEGIEEYEPSTFSSSNVFVEVLDEPEKLNAKTLSYLQSKHNVRRVMVEYNGMWLLDVLYQALPKNWVVYQEFMFADFTTFLNYNANMRSLMYDKLKSCELLVVNRTPYEFDMVPIHKIVRGANRGCDIAYEHEDSSVTYDNIEDPLPYDVNADIIEIADDDYGLWYMDCAENTSDYIGKTIRIRALTMRNKLINAKSEIIVGRQIMTCCADDITYKGLLCKAPSAHDFAQGEWVLLTAKITFEKHRVYKEEKGPVLTALSIEKTTAPEKPVADLLSL